jgi:hypothetical protein
MGTEGLPWRGPGPGRPDLALPPGRLAIRRRGSWRKSWRYLGVFSDELLLCAARVGLGPAGQTFWAVWDRESGEMRERTRMLSPLARGEVWTEALDEDAAGRLEWAPDEGGALVRIEASAKDDSEQIRAFLRIPDASPWVEAVTPSGERDNYTWTRKRIPRVDCDVRIGERRIRTEARGIEDESAGYHRAHTVWDWSAGVGTTADGRAVGWNLVAGVNDPPERSERALWIDGEPSEPGPVRFDDLEAIDCDGGRLEFTAICERAKAEKRPFISYSYRQPFGTFGGTLPGGIALERGVGVMEHHDAHW